MIGEYVLSITRSTRLMLAALGSGESQRTIPRSGVCGIFYAILALSFLSEVFSLLFHHAED